MYTTFDVVFVAEYEKKNTNNLKLMNYDHILK